MMETLGKINWLTLIFRVATSFYLFGFVLSVGTNGTIRVGLNKFEQTNFGNGVRFEVKFKTTDGRDLKSFTTRVYPANQPVFFTTDLGNGLNNPITFDVPDDIFTSVTLTVSCYNGYIKVSTKEFIVKLEPGFNKIGEFADADKKFKISYAYHGPDRRLKGTCTPQGNYICGSRGQKICKEGFTNPKEDCNTVNNCHAECGQNYEYCFTNGTKSVCYCKPGFKGEKCDLVSCNPMLRDTCKNGGTCFRGNNGYVCECSPLYSGDYCQNQLCSNSDSRADPRCNNEAYLCQQTSNSKFFSCSCKPGYRMSNGKCEKEYSLCISNPCVNGGTCRDIGTDFECSCAQGFGGKRCQKSKDWCETNPCPTGNVCLNTPDRYECVPIDRQDCSDDICANGGTCVEDKFHFRCLCASGFSGPTCTKADI